MPHYDKISCWEGTSTVKDFSSKGLRCPWGTAHRRYAWRSCCSCRNRCPLLGMDSGSWTRHDKLWLSSGPSMNFQGIFLQVRLYPGSLAGTWPTNRGTMICFSKIDRSKCRSTGACLREQLSGGSICSHAADLMLVCLCFDSGSRVLFVT